ncbi:hypothetical protein HZB93_03890 [Candidatus Falkowbacteria bacterium]|nr:hypothetical protein [Candidatus Falkowbacteria bacterium]
MDFLTTVPLLWGRPANIWLGIILGVLLIFQIYLGIMMVRGRMNLLKLHKINAAFLFIIALIHAYWGLGIWFFNFQIK